MIFFSADLPIAEARSVLASIPCWLEQKPDKTSVHKEPPNRHLWVSKCHHGTTASRETADLTEVGEKYVSYRDSASKRGSLRFWRCWLACLDIGIQPAADLGPSTSLYIRSHAIGTVSSALSGGRASSSGNTGCRCINRAFFNERIVRHLEQQNLRRPECTRRDTGTGANRAGRDNKSMASGRGEYSPMCETDQPACIRGQ